MSSRQEPPVHSDTGVSAQAATAVGLAAGEADLAADGGATGAAQLPAPAPRPASPGGSSEAEGGSEAGSISNSEEEDVGPQPADSLRRRRVSAERGGKPPLQLTPEAVACSAFIDLQHPITLYEGAAAGRGCAIRVGHPVAAYAGPQAADAHASLQAASGAAVDPPVGPLPPVCGRLLLRARQRLAQHACRRGVQGNPRVQPPLLCGCRRHSHLLHALRRLQGRRCLHPVHRPVWHCAAAVFHREERERRQGQPARLERRRCAAIADRAADRKFPLLALAPEATTKAQPCLLKFRRGAFAAGQPVCPVLLKYSYRHFNPGWGIVNTPFHLYRLMAQLINHLEITVLPPYFPSDEEQKDWALYAENVRSLMGKELGVPLVEEGFAEERQMWRARVGVNLRGTRVIVPPPRSHAD